MEQAGKTMADSVRLIKKYPNRRLYDTRTSAYITLADVKDLVLKNEKFQVVDGVFKQGFPVDLHEGFWDGIGDRPEPCP